MPEFWEWVAHNGRQGRVKMPLEVHEEIKGGDDDLGEWARESEIKAALLLDEEVDASLVSRIIDEGYAPDLTDDEVEKVGRDPFLIAYALARPGNRCIVTTERSSPRGNAQTVTCRTSAAISGYPAMTRFDLFASSTSGPGGGPRRPTGALTTCYDAGSAGSNSLHEQQQSSRSRSLPPAESPTLKR